MESYQVILPLAPIPAANTGVLSLSCNMSTLNCHLGMQRAQYHVVRQRQSGVQQAACSLNPRLSHCPWYTEGKLIPVEYLLSARHSVFTHIVSFNLYNTPLTTPSSEDGLFSIHIPSPELRELDKYYLPPRGPPSIQYLHCPRRQLLATCDHRALEIWLVWLNKPRLNFISF